MNRKGFAMNDLSRGILLAVLILGVPGFAAPRPVVEKPNFIVVFIDDMGYADIGPFAATPHRTPALDQDRGTFPKPRSGARP